MTWMMSLCVKGAIIYDRERGSVCLWGGGPEFFGMVNGRDHFFSVGRRGGGFFRVKEGGPIFPGCKGGTKIFFTYAKGGPEKIGDWQSQTPPSR